MPAAGETMGLGDFTKDKPSTFGRDRAFINTVDDVFPNRWYKGRTQPFQFLSVIEQYLGTHGPDSATRYRRARLDVARAYDVTERTISRACENIYSEPNRDRFVADLEKLEERLTDE